MVWVLLVLALGGHLDVRAYRTFSLSINQYIFSWSLPFVSDKYTIAAVYVGGHLQGLLAHEIIEMERIITNVQSYSKHLFALHAV